MCTPVTKRGQSSQAFLFKVSELHQEKQSTKRGSMTTEVKGRGRDNEC